MENKGLKEAQDCSVEMSVNKLPSWVMHELKFNICLVIKHQHSVQNDQCQMIILFRMQNDSFVA